MLVENDLSEVLWGAGMEKVENIVGSSVSEADMGSANHVSVVGADANNVATLDLGFDSGDAIFGDVIQWGAGDAAFHGGDPFADFGTISHVSITFPGALHFFGGVGSPYPAKSPSQILDEVPAFVVLKPVFEVVKAGEISLAVAFAVAVELDQL